MSTDPHAFRDKHNRNLCDVCDRWAGSPIHGKHQGRVLFVFADDGSRVRVMPSLAKLLTARGLGAVSEANDE